MGCGYSKTNSKKRRRLKDNLDVCSDSSDPDQSPEFGSEKYRRLESSPETLKKNGLVNLTEDALASRRRIANKIKPISGPMRPPINRSASQLSFFRMLDEKIANGKDLDEETLDDTEELLRSDISDHNTDDDINIGENEDDVALVKRPSSVVVSSCPSVVTQTSSRPNTANGSIKSMMMTRTDQFEFGENNKVLSQDNVIQNGTELMTNGQAAS